MKGANYEDVAMVDAELEQDSLIPSLPDDVARHCLLRVPPKSHAQLQLVSPRWRELVTSPEFYQERKREGTSEKLLCLVQAIEPPLIVTAKSLPAAKRSPVFGISVLNVQRRSWERLPPIPDFPESLPIFCRMVAVDGKLIVLGGWNPTTYQTLRSVYIFHFGTQLWSRGSCMPTERSFFACASTSDNEIMVAGGHDNNKTALKSAELYNVDTDEWTSLPPMQEERDESTGVCLDGSFYVISGYSSNAQGQFTESAEVYDPSRKEWSLLEGVWRENFHPPGPFAVMLGRLYMLQGQNLCVFNVVAGTWSVVETIPDGELNPVCVAAVDDALLVTGPSRNQEELGFSTVLYKPRCKNGWESFERQVGFVGMAQSSHAIEI